MSTRANKQPHSRYWESCPECTLLKQDLVAQGRSADDASSATRLEHAEAALRFMGVRRCRDIVASAKRALQCDFNEQEARDLLIPYALNEWLPPPKGPRTATDYLRAAGVLLFLLMILGIVATGALRSFGFNVGSGVYCEFLGGPDCPH
jgi:hypothetical protein